MKQLCRISRLIISAALVLLLILSLGSNASAAHGDAPRHVLLLNSYHQPMTWVDNIVQAVYDELQPEQNNLVLHVENMDSKRFHNPEYLRSLYQAYRVKYSQTDFDLILSSDNNAFDFLRRYRDELFPKVPVAFCGVNFFQPEQLTGHQGYTGVEEVFDAAATLRIALHNQPQTREVLVINDYLKTGRAWEKSIRQQLAPFAGQVNVNYIDNLSLEELERHIATMPDDSILLLGAYFSDREGQYVTYERIGALLARASKVPVYSLLEFNIGTGVLGGNVISGYSQGQAMAILGQRILRGENPDKLPVQHKGANRNIFNFLQLQRFAIDPELLPAKRTIINRPYSPYREYQELIWLTGGFISLLLLAIVALTVNIRLRRTAEQGLRESEQKLRGLFNQTFGFMGLLSPDGTLIDANQTALNFIAARKNEVCGTPFWETPWWGHLPEAQQQVRKAISHAAQGETVRFETSHPAADGSIHLFDFSLRPLYNDAGDIIYLIPEGRDITERKENEHQLHKAQSYIRNILDSMPSMIISVDPAGRITQWNMEAEKATGTSAAEAKGRQLIDVLPRLKNQMEQVKVALKDRQPHRQTKVAGSEDSQARFSDITVYPLIANGVDGAVIRVDDVTERVQLEEMMIQSEKMLSVGGLAAGMAHEINNPLAGILQSSQVLLNRLNNDLPKSKKIAEELDVAPERINQYLDRLNFRQMLNSIHESGLRAARIVENILNFSRKTDSHMPHQDLSQLVDKTLELAANDFDLKSTYDFRKIEILRDYAENLPEVTCDATQIQQVLLNLLRNGAQAMWTTKHERNPQFTLCVRREDEDAVIEISDNGPGMNADLCKRIFEPFFTTKEVGEGTGLGLSVSYFIITEHHRGRMDVESAPGNGTRFTIQLPLTQE